MNGALAVGKLANDQLLAIMKLQGEQRLVTYRMQLANAVCARSRMSKGVFYWQNCEQGFQCSLGEDWKHGCGGV